MKKENIKKAGFIIDEIERIESEILQLDKIAQLITGNQTKISFKLSVEDLDKKEKILNEDGSIIKSREAEGYKSIFSGFMSSINNASDYTNKTDLEQELSDIETYELLGLLLSVKKRNISFLQDQLLIL